MTPLWTPSEAYISQSNLKKYEHWLEENQGLTFDNYHEMWKWSVKNISDFWESIWEFFEIKSYSDYEKVLLKTNQSPFIGKWFEGSTLSYAEHVFRNKTTQFPAIIFKSETQPNTIISWAELENGVKNIQKYLLEKGIKKGDRVAGYLPNTPEAIIAFLATNSLGAIWSCCSPDFGLDSILDRFQQIEPKVLFACESYSYGGKVFNKTDVVEAISAKISSIQDTLIINSTTWNQLLEEETDEPLTFTPVEFSHPIWILYSSGTTGKPKAITHSTGGNMIEHLKALSLHQDVQAGDRYLWYSTTGWMMWNFSVSSLLCGATLCLYDGSPGFPDMNILWDFANENQVNHFGGGAAFYISCMKNNIQMPEITLKTLGSTGSPLPPEAFKWIYENISKNVHLISLSGGTDVCSAFMGGCPYLPVYEGEIQCRMLGASIEAWNDEGKSVLNEVGELVLTEPMPSMPVYFWNDADNQRYKGSYFEKYKGVWCHGDWIKITENDGIIILGRSDATLNRDGVRIGTAEIYNAVEAVNAIKDSLVVCIERENGTAFMPLFVVLKENYMLDNEIIKEIKTQLRKTYSPRHVPDVIIEVPDIPYTISGKKMEMPIKKILMKTPLEKAVSLDTMRNPTSLEWFVEYAKQIITE